MIQNCLTAMNTVIEMSFISGIGFGLLIGFILHDVLKMYYQEK